MNEHPTRLRRTPSQRRSRELVDSILIATSRLLASTPLERLTTPRIADVAGVSIGSLYQYFSGKESIVARVIERKADQAVSEVVERIEHNVDATLVGLVRGLVDSVIEVHRRDRGLFAAILPFAPVLARSTVVREVQFESRERARRFLEKHRDEIRDGDLEIMIFIASRALEHLVHAAVLERPELLDDLRFRDEVTLLLARYLARDPASVA